MSPHQLELFYHVARCKGVSRAARQMPYGIQQPSVSLQVNALERDLGVALYERRPFRLTPAGEELFKFIEPFFSGIPALRKRLQGAARIRVGASPIVFRDYLPPVIEAVRRQFPELNMILRALNQPDLIEGIESDKLDLVISLVPDALGASLCVHEIVALPLVLLAPKTSRVKSAAELWKKSGRVTQALISLEPGELICRQFQRELGKIGVTWLPTIEMDSLDLIENYVAAGYGFGLSIRRPDHKESSMVRVIELSGFPPVKMGVLYRRQSVGTDRVCGAFLREILKQAARFH